MIALGRAALAVLLFALAGCGSEAAPAAPPAGDGRHGAALPQAPRDVRPLSADPCAAITAAQLRALGFEPAGERVTLPTGEASCEWRGPAGSPYTNVGVATARDILVDTYRVRQFSIFRPTTIDDLPAVVEQTNATSISCNVTVGTAQNQGFLVIYDGTFKPDGQPNDPCGQAQQIAQRVVAALPMLPAK
ncbi:DUF3558 domain-containing protein [Actinomycetospora straminea]|uniref:DUF3558 domain-containing protein n=1 Tax=Actinomycetospora straminea TaxID=663607 RepID=A0ABP9ERA1_9PSEU|nr:DUF3558 domain-containing protein [Actinomycetospora straminea]MDD7933999.1 DUF3558 domain-containing protein [Actinomycetospora straminea]